MALLISPMIVPIVIVAVGDYTAVTTLFSSAAIQRVLLKKSRNQRSE
jgi:hypothetical protein